MRSISIVVALLIGAWTMGAAIAAAESEVAVLDDCNPNDPGWAPTGGCALEEGDVSVAEFLALLPPGHPAWRNEPSYLKIELGETVTVTNEGGRRHTFTEVAKFGGGFVPVLNAPLGLTPAPECVTSSVVGPTILPAGTSLAVSGLSGGNHFFQCCIHPWMRAEIKVKAEQD